MCWRGSNWVRHDQKGTCVLRILYDQLIITAETKIVESLNMNSKMKGFFKGDVLILVICNEKGVRKLKFVLKNDVSQCLEALSRHFPVVNHGTLSKSASMRYRNIDEVLKGAIETIDRQGEISFFCFMIALNRSQKKISLRTYISCLFPIGVGRDSSHYTCYDRDIHCTLH